MESTIILAEQQKQEMIDRLTEELQPVLKAVEEVLNDIKEIFIQLWKSLKVFLEKNKKCIKYMKIYNRTHNQRIKKKQIAKILKLLKEKIKKCR